VNLKRSGEAGRKLEYPFFDGFKLVLEDIGRKFGNLCVIRGRTAATHR
jgi:hypothetical protein